MAANRKPWAWGGITPGQQSALAFGGVNRGQLLTGKVGFQPFKPYVPPPVPTGSYDPAIDAQVGQAQRGLGDLTADTETANTRGVVDYGLGEDAINRAQGRETQDWQTQSQALQRQYQQLAGVQQEQQNSAGVLRGGAGLQAAAKREANQALVQAGLDTAHARSGEDTTLALGNLALSYAPPSADNPLGGRSFQDRTTALTRAQRENTNFGLDATAEKLFQAGQQGYVPPSRGEPGGLPRGEHIDAFGTHTRTATIGGVQYVYDAKGNIVSKKRVGSTGGTQAPAGAAGFRRVPSRWGRTAASR